MDKPTTTISQEQLAAVAKWMNSDEGKAAFDKSQEEVTDKAVKLIEGYSCFEPSRLKQPYTL